MDAVILQYYMRQQRRPRIVRDRSNPLDYMDDVELHAKFRFVREHILPIIEMIHNVVTFQTQRGCGLPSSLQVLIALRFYATGMFQDVIGELVGVTQVTVCRTIKRVTNALFQHVNEHIQPPSQARSNQQKQKFFSMRGIPNIFGCIDGTHIRIQAPSPVDQAVPFMNRKNYYSLNVQSADNSQSTSFQHLLQTNYARAMNLRYENVGIYDMNELPYVSQSRSLLLVVCVVMFFTAFCVYVPLGNIQADYNGKCFLNSKLHFEINKLPSNKSAEHVEPKMRLHAVKTEWGPVFECDMTTFTPVMVGILSMIIGWSTFTVWPTMMEMGKGGGLMLVYSFLFTLCLGTTVASTVILFAGYNKTCLNLDSFSISCTQLNSKGVKFKSDGEYIIVRDVHRAIVIAEVASTALIGLSCLQIFVCLGTFGIIWYHFNFLALQLYSTDNLSVSLLSERGRSHDTIPQREKENSLFIHPVRRSYSQPYLNT